MLQLEGEHATETSLLEEGLWLEKQAAAPPVPPIPRLAELEECITVLMRERDELQIAETPVPLPVPGCCVEEDVLPTAEQDLANWLFERDTHLRDAIAFDHSQSVGHLGRLISEVTAKVRETFWVKITVSIRSFRVIRRISFRGVRVR